MKIISFILFFLLQLPCLFAQFKYDLPQFKDETIEFIQQPSNWDGDDLLKIGLIGAGTFLVMQIDEPIRDWMKKDQAYAKSFPMEFGRMYGELYSPIALAGSIGIYSLIQNDKSARKVAYEILQTSFYAGAVTTLLKVITGRARPFMEKSSHSFLHLKPFDNEFLSLPSGHSTLAFSISTVLANNSNSTIIKILCYIPAVLTAISRVYQDQHWTSDVFLGAVIGYTVGNFVTSVHEGENIIQAATPQQFSIAIPFN